MVVGFCTAVMNRCWQAAQTLADNLARLRGTGSFIALADYHSDDELPALVRSLGADLDAGTLLYFRTDEPRHFHSSKAKNLAHRLALRRAPDVLFNLDADNRLSAETLAVVEDTFRQEPEPVLHNWSTVNGDGTSGRVALRASRWLELGGYDEALLAASWQDIDLLIRCRAAGLRYVLEPRGVPAAVSNTMADRVAYLEPIAARGDAGARYLAMYQQNLIISLGRPCRLPLREQRRFAGHLNFAGELVVI